jgi:acetolactate synthase-1/2/3 large subunit
VINQLAALSGADVMALGLVERDVDTIFCITGAGNLALVDAILRQGIIKLVYSHHEQAAVMEAQGYARVSGKVGVALLTTGGGTSNALTGVLSAQLDSVPILMISGNESSFHCQNMAEFRAFGVQGFDSVSVFEPVTKFTARIAATKDISGLLDQAWIQALEFRQGVAHLDFPMDLQRTFMDSQPMASEQRPNPLDTREKTRTVDPQLLKLCISDLVNAKSPMLYLGNGVRSAGAVNIAREIIERYQLPFLLSWSAIDIIEEAHPLNMGRVGIYGDRASNILLQRSDLLLCVGTRLAIPQIGYDQGDFARCAKRWVVDTDSVELTKFTGTNWNLVEGDAQDFLAQISGQLNLQGHQPTDGRWLSECARVWASLPRCQQSGPDVEPDSGYVHSSRVMEYLSGAIAPDAVVVTDVGAGLLSGHYSLDLKAGQRLFTSQGLGEMGFGLPGAIGAYFADSSRQIVCLNTDGGIMFNLQELQTIRHHEIPMKLFVFNNSGYSMIRISQENLFGSRYAGVNPDSGVSFPDFAAVASAFGLAHSLVTNCDDFATEIAPALKSARAELVEIRMSPDQKYLPRLATRKLPDGTLSSPPLEDMDPYISIELLEDLLGTAAHRNSYVSRGLADG